MSCDQAVLTAVMESPVTGNLTRKSAPRKELLTDRSYLYVRGMNRKIARVAPKYHGLIVDYGASDKPFEVFFTAAKRYVGVDFNRCDSHDLLLTPEGGIPMEAGSVDAVVSFQALEHVPDVPFYLAECGRVLKPGGRLLLTTHGIWSYHPAPPAYEDYWRWTPAGLRKIVTESGFQIENVSCVLYGWQCIIQQLLVMTDLWVWGAPRWYRGLRKLTNVFMNLAALPLKNFAGDEAFWLQRGNIMPINFVVEARKN